MDSLTELATFRQKAQDHYIRKAYQESIDEYAQASELQAQVYGEEDPLNAELLYLYGRALYKVGISKSDVLGAKAAEEDVKQQSAKKAAEQTSDSAATNGAGSIADAIKRGDGETLAEAMAKKGSGPQAFFSMSGDENLEDEADDADADDGEAPKGEEEDELSLAWEILDLSRVLFNKQLEMGSADTNSSDQAVTDPSKPPPRKPDPKESIQKFLAEVHDLLAEISLEGEDFPAAASDFRSSLELKKELYPQSSSLIAEAHFKLSLALEFASNTTTMKDKTGQLKSEARDVPDEVGRKDAAAEMEAAIASCHARVQAEEEGQGNLGDGKDDGGKKEKARKEIAEVKEMIEEMQQRLADLRARPQSEGQKSEREELKDMLGAIMGQVPENAKKQIQAAVEGANDLTGLVRKKAAKVVNVGASQANGEATVGTKRKASQELPVRSPGPKERPEESGSKKVRVEEVEDDGT